MSPHERPAAGDKPDLSALRIADHARAERKGGRGALWIAAAVLLVAGALAAGLTALAWDRPVAVRVTTARAGGAGGGPAVLLNASGYVTARRQAELRAKVVARIAEVLVEEGDSVQAGQTVVRLDPTDAQNRLRIADGRRAVVAASVLDLEVELEDARRRLRRATALGEQGLASTQTREEAQTAVDRLLAQITVAQAQVQQAAAEVELSRRELADCKLTTPFAGVVIDKQANVGELVMPDASSMGRALVTLVDMASLELEVDVNEAHIAKIKPGAPVLATLDAYPEWKIPATVATVIPTADRQKATVRVRLSFDQLDPRILPNMGAKVAFLEVNEPASEGAAPPQAWVPRGAVVDQDGQSVVYVVNEQRAERRAVRVGGESSGDRAVTAGLQGGETIVVDVPPSLVDGAVVEIEH